MNGESVSLGRYAEHPFSRRAAKVMTRGNTRSTLFVPPAVPYAVRGEGSIVEDQLGHTVIDCNNNYTSLIHGHAFAPVTDAASAILRSGTAFGLPTEHEVALGELLAGRTGQPVWRFSNSGTEAVMTAIRAARAFTGRGTILRFEGSYHGTSDAVVSATAPGITAGVRSEIIEVPQGDREAFDAAIAARGPEIAAVLIDIMPNRAGLVPAEQGFIDHLRAETRRIGSLLIVDEVISLRLAEGGLAKEYGADADLITAGKIIGGGFAVGAVGGRSDVLSVFDPLGSSSVAWGGTFSANPMTMVAGRIAMEHFDGDAATRLNANGDRLRESLTSAGIAATGRGSLLRLREELPLDRLWWALYSRGVLAGTNGLIALATTMTDTHLERVETGIVNAVRALRAERGSE